jgi:nucleoside-diphosphate-sugar epimerase
VPQGTGSGFLWDDRGHVVTNYHVVQNADTAKVTLGEQDEALGQVWHVPNPETVTMRRFVEMVFETTSRPPRLRVPPRWGIALGALFDPTLRAVKEQLYQSERPWVVDSSRFENAFGWSAAPLPSAVAATAAWFHDQSRS